jgi:hypothetical protein
VNPLTNTVVWTAGRLRWTIDGSEVVVRDIEAGSAVTPVQP